MATYVRVQRARCFIAFRRLMSLGFVPLLLLFALSAKAATYVYDANGRLRAATNSAGETSEYIYDALGNLYAVDHVRASQLAIFSFTPNRGKPGSASVRIFGKGFGATPNANVVRFNGVPASSIVSSTSTELLVTVPVGATTGPISVEAGGATASSLDNFQITSDDDGQSPVIDSFSPTIAAPGAAISVSGSRFISAAGPTLAGVNQLANAVVPVSDSQLTFSVPARTGSGPITVVTPYGAGQSAMPLIVVPTGVAPADVIATVNLAIDGSSQSVNVGEAGKYAAATFTGAAGQLLSIQVDQWSPASSGTSLSVTVYDLTGAAVTAANSLSSAGTLTVHLPALPRSGTYLVLAAPSDGAQFAFRVESALELDAASRAINLQPSQSRRVQFVAPVPPYAGFWLSNLVTAPSGGVLSIRLFDPRNQPLTSWSVSSDQWINAPILVSAQMYTALVQAISNSSSVTAQLGLLPAPTMNLAANAPGMTIQTLRSRQYAYLNFTATQGENLGLGISNLTVTDASTPRSSVAYVAVYAPDGTSWNYNPSCLPPACDVNLGAAPVTGTYTVVAQPYPFGTGTLSFDATLSDDLVVPLPANTTTAMNLSRSGQNGRFTFDGVAGATVAVQVGGITTTPANQLVTLTVLKPDGSILAGTAKATGYTFNLTNLPATGTYTVFVDPADGATASLSATYAISPRTPLSVGGSSVSASTAVSGQYAYFTFTATQGANLGLGISNLTVTDASTPRSSAAYVAVYAPDGTSWNYNPSCLPPACDVNLGAAPVTGTYTVVAQPYPFGTGTLSFDATLSDDLVVPLPANTTTAMNLSRSGQNGRFTFDAAAGTTVAVQIGGITTTPANQLVTLTVLKPDGSILAGTAKATGYTFNLTNLPATGTYTVFVDPADGATASLSATYAISPRTPLSVGGGSVFASTVVSGQYAYFTFTATQGANLGLGISNLTVTDASTPRSSAAYVAVYTPDGTSWNYNPSCLPPACDVNLGAAPVTGTYTVVAQPYPFGTGTLSFDATLSDDLVVPLPANTTTAMNLSRSGQNGRFTFDGVAGATVAVQVGGITTTPANQLVTLTVLKPDGSILAGTTTATGYTFNLTNLPATGTYTVFVDPADGATATLNASLSRP